MQPTLNGIVGYPLSEEEYAERKPNFAAKWWDIAFAGRKFVNETMDEDKTLEAVVTGTRFKFFQFTRLIFTDGTHKELKVPLGALRGGLGFRFTFQHEARRHGTGNRSIPDGSQVLPVELKKGQVIARGYVDTGDQVLVDKISYHFRSPRRGEVFVFSTKDISGISVPLEQGSQHYIKRLVGVPGDQLEVRGGELFVNGARATEPGMVMVMEEYPESHKATHGGYEGSYSFDLTGKREYVAMGDNSRNSADSRSWGTVPEVNVVGPAFVVYWPFAHHWGRIR
jgi:signal peptidase I